MIDSRKLTLGQFEGMCMLDPRLRNLVARLTVTTYEEFLTILYRDIDYAVSLVEGDAHLLADDGEDRISVDLVHQLKTQGYEVEHGIEHRGRTDIFVRGREPSFRWIGEAKIHGAYDTLFEGFLQLCTRYSVGTEQGGLLIYIKGQNGKEVMDRWLAHLRKKSLPDYREEPCNAKACAFFSTHLHQDSGLPFRVRHIPVFLGFAPKDKSARSSAAHTQQR